MKGGKDLNVDKLSNNVSLEFSPLAKDDLAEIWDYLSERNRDAADALVEKLFEVCVLVAENPKLGVPRHDVMVDIRLFPSGHYNIFYFSTPKGVEIYRILHSSRDNVQVFDDSIHDLQ